MSVWVALALLGSPQGHAGDYGVDVALEAPTLSTQNATYRVETGQLGFSGGLGVTVRRATAQPRLSLLFDVRARRRNLRWGSGSTDPTEVYRATLTEGSLAIGVQRSLGPVDALVQPYARAAVGVQAARYQPDRLFSTTSSYVPHLQGGAGLTLGRGPVRAHVVANALLDLGFGSYWGVVTATDFAENPPSYRYFPGGLGLGLSGGLTFQ